MPDAPTLQYPTNLHDVAPEVKSALRQTFDNLFYLRNLVDQQGTNAPLTQQQIEQVQVVVTQISGSSTSTVTGSQFISDTHAIRIAFYTAADVGTIYWETDRNALYVMMDVSGVLGWVFVCGMMTGAFTSRPTDLSTPDAGFGFYANGDAPSYNHVWRWSGTNWVVQYGEMRGTISPNQKPAGLGADDANFTFYSTDFVRPYRWTGVVWVDGDNAPARDYVQPFRVAPSGNGWQLCDGSVNITISKSDGTTQLITVPDLTAGTYLRSNAAYSGPAPTAANGAAVIGASANESAHIHVVDPPATTSAAPAGLTLVDNDLVGSTVNVAASNHTHAVDIAPFNSAAGSAHSHGPGSFGTDATEQPRHEDFIYYIRL